MERRVASACCKSNRLFSNGKLLLNKIKEVKYAANKPHFLAASFFAIEILQNFSITHAVCMHPEN